MKKLFFTLATTIVLSLVASGQANPNNALDYIGRIHNDVVTSFVNQYAGQGLTIAQICANTERIANSNTDFLKVKDASYTPVRASLIEEASADFKNQFSKSR